MPTPVPLQHTIEEISSNWQEDTLASKMGSNFQTAQKQYQKQDSKRKLESSLGKKKKENQKSRINDNTYVTKPPPGKRQKNGKAWTRVTPCLCRISRWEYLYLCSCVCRSECYIWVLLQLCSTCFIIIIKLSW